MLFTLIRNLLYFVRGSLDIFRLLKKPRPSQKGDVILLLRDIAFKVYCRAVCFNFLWNGRTILFLYWTWSPFIASEIIVCSLTYEVMHVLCTYMCHLKIKQLINSQAVSHIYTHTPSPGMIYLWPSETEIISTTSLTWASQHPNDQTHLQVRFQVLMVESMKLTAFWDKARARLRGGPAAWGTNLLWEL
jgi:hypothetical protein